MSLHISVTSVNMQILNVKSLYQLATKKKDKCEKWFVDIDKLSFVSI